LVSLALFVVWTAGIAVPGAIAAASITASRRVVALLGSGVVVGLATFVFLGNVLAHLMPPRWAFLLTWIILVAAAAFYRRRLPRLSWQASLGLFTIAGLILLLQALVVLPTFYHDVEGHYAFTSFVAWNQFPLDDPFLPTYALQYHYGIDLLAAALAQFAGVEIHRSHDFIALACVLGAIGVAMSIGDELGGTHGAWVGALLFCFGGGLLWLKVFDPGAHSLSDLFSSRTPFSPLLHGNSSHAFVFEMLRPPVALGVPLFVLTLRASAALAEPRLLPAATATVLLAALGLVEESAFAAAAAGMAAAILVQLLRAKERMKPFLGFLPLAMASVAVLIQGGVIGNHLSPYPVRPSLASIAFRWPPVMLGFVEPIYQPIELATVPYVFREFGWFLPGFFLLGPWALRRASLLAVWLGAGAAVAAPFLFEFPSHDTELVRFFGYFQAGAALLTGCALVVSIQNSQVPTRRVAQGALALVLATALLGAGFSYGAYFRESGFSPTNDPVPAAEHVMARWMRDENNVPASARIVVAGTAWTFVGASGYRSPYPYWNFGSPDIYRRASLLEEEAMRAVGVTHLYQEGNRSADKIAPWLCGGRLKVLHSETIGPERRTLYAFDWAARASCP
jgi:hypothetical protein